MITRRQKLFVLIEIRKSKMQNIFNYVKLIFQVTISSGDFQRNVVDKKSADNVSFNVTKTFFVDQINELFENDNTQSVFLSIPSTIFYF